MNYGDELKVLKILHARDVMCVAQEGEYLYMGCKDCLSVADLSNPQNPERIADFFLRGECRQITVKNSIAFITAREQALYIIDVADPYHPVLICHYDSIELATGVCVYGNLLYIAQRQYGVEIVDISKIDQPRHLCRIKTSEAQSVDAIEGYLYVGDWGTRELTTIDVHDPYHPFIVHQHKLGGYGDGVYVSGSYLYAATGHHAKSLQTPVSESDEGFGMGHGLEIFDLQNPAKPVFISRFQFPKLYQRVKYDMWNVTVSGDIACCADTYNGIFLLDVKDKAHPVAVGHYQTLTGGTAIGDTCLYGACVNKGLLVFQWTEAKKAQLEKEQLTNVPGQSEISPNRRYRTFRPGGQIWAVSFIDEYAMIAAGMQGLIIARLWPQLQVVDIIKTNGFALFVDTFGDKVIVSEGCGGATIWQHLGGGKLSRLGKYNPEYLFTVRQAKFYADGRYAILQCQYNFVILDLVDPANPRVIDQDPMLIVYWDQMCAGFIEGRYTCVFDHPNGIRWIDFGRPDQEMVTGVHLTNRFSLMSGLAAVKDQILVVYPGGYKLARAMDEELEQVPVVLHGGKIVGKPRIIDSILCVSNRITAEVEIVDLSDIQNPRLIDAFSTEGTPAEIVIQNNSLVIPDGYQGLHIWDDYIE